MKKAHLIVSLDPSSTHVGFCFATGTQYVESGVFIPDGDTATTRISQIALWWAGVMESTHPDIVALEIPAANFSHKNHRTDRILARVYGAIEGVTHTEALRNSWDSPQIIPIYPAQVKATGVSKENPRYAAAYVGKDLVGLDEADAIGVWVATLKKIRELGLDL